MPYMPPYKRKEHVAKRLTGLIDNGVTMATILDTLSAEFGTDIPSSSSTFYKVYGDDIAKARASFADWLGNKARQRIDEGSDRILELALRSKAGWKPQESIEVTEGDGSHEGSSALDVLMEKLGKKAGTLDEEDEQ